MARVLNFSAYSEDEILEKFNQNKDFIPTLGFIFSSVVLDIPLISAAFSERNLPIIGCSSAGEILPESDGTVVHEQTAACCFLDPDPDFFSVRLFELEHNFEKELGTSIGEWGMDTFKEPAFILFISGIHTNSEPIVRGIKSVCPEKTPIFGGVAGDDGKFEETYVFTQNGYTTQGTVVIVFDRSKVQVDGIATSGWVGVGIEMTVTSSEGNTVYTINDRPATSIFKDYLNVSDEMLQQVGVIFPLLMKRPDGSEVLRAFLSVNKEKQALIFAGSVPQGVKVQFSSSFGYETIEKTITELREFHTSHNMADIILLFSCVARHHVAGSMVNDEISVASGLWNAPLIGFFTYGEIGNNRSGICDFYNETLCLVLLNFTV